MHTVAGAEPGAVKAARLHVSSGCEAVCHNSGWPSALLAYREEEESTDEATMESKMQAHVCTQLSTQGKQTLCSVLETLMLEEVSTWGLLSCSRLCTKATHAAHSQSCLQYCISLWLFIG